MTKSNKTDGKPDVDKLSQKHETRRKAVRAIVLGGGSVTAAKGLPSEWAAPIVNAVVLPGHAATTDDTGIISTANTTPPASTTQATTPAPTTTLCPSGYYFHPEYAFEDDNGCRTYPHDEPM